MAFPVSIIGNDSVPVMFQISHITDTPPNGRAFLVKNITDNNISATVTPILQKELISTVFYSGWNPEILVKIEGAPEGLQYGY